MARFVLVHGAFSGGWIWEPLAKRLRAAGHIAEAPDLPGSGEDHTTAGGVTLGSLESGPLAGVFAVVVVGVGEVLFALALEPAWISALSAEFWLPTVIA